MADPYSSTNLPQKAIAREVLVNAADGTGRMDVGDLALQLVGTGLIPTDTLSVATWNVLKDIVGEFEGQGARTQDTDTGTHTDPVVGGTVPNSGDFTWSVSPAGWKRIGASQIGNVLDRLNQYYVVAAAFVTVDFSDQKIRFPTMYLNRNGQAFKTVVPADYSLSVFEFSMSSASVADFWYLDVAAIGTATVPIKKTTTVTVPVPGRDIVPLGFSLRGLFMPFAGFEVRYTDRHAQVNAVSAADAIIVDRIGRYGSAGVYIPKTVYVDTANGGIGIGGDDQRLQTPITLSNAAHSTITTHVKFAIASFSGSRSVILDLETSTASLVAYPSRLEGSSRPYVNLATVNDLGVSSLHGLEIIYTESTDRNNYYPEVPIVLERDVILVPQGKYRDAKTGAITAVNFSDGAFWKEVSAPNVLTNATYLTSLWYDALDGTFKTTQVDGIKPHQPSYSAAKLVSVIRGMPSGDLPVAGYGGWGTPQNQCPYGKNSEGLPRPFADTVFVDITNASLLALGFTRGWTAPTGYRSLTGMDFPTPRPGQRAFFRFYVQTSVDDDWGLPRVFLWSTSALIGSAIALNLEKRISARAAIFSASFVLPNDSSLTYFWAGADRVASETTVRICTGLQFHCGDMPAWWILREDYSSSLTADVSQILPDVTPDFALPPRIFLTSGRELPFYPQNCLTRRADGDTVETTIASLKTSDSNKPFVRSGTDFIELNADRLGSAMEVNFRKKGRADYASTRYRQSVNVTVAPATGSGARTILVIGDSLANRRKPQFLSDKLTARGYTPTFIGTIPCNTASGDNGVLCEAREGHEIADLIYYNTDAESPIAVGGEAAYLALSKTNKLTKGPFLRASTGGDPAGRIFNGYIWDLAFYLSRFALATPTHIILDLHTNDISQQSAATALLQVQKGLATVVAQIREVSSSIKIGLSCDIIGRSAADSRWATHMTILREHIKFVRDLGDANTHVLSPYLHQSWDAGWPISTLSTDADTGLITGSISDIIHFDDPERHVAAEVWASFVAAA